MGQAEFMEATQNLCELYNKSLNNTQVEFWYRSLKNVELNLYRQAIAEYTRVNKYMPTIADILDFIKMIKSRNKATEQKEEPSFKRVPCNICHGSGLVKYIKENYDYYCVCICENGQRLDYPMLKKYADLFPFADENSKLDYDLTAINF